MTSHALRFLVVVVKIAPSIARSPGKDQNINRSTRAGQGKQPGGFTKLCTGLLYTNSKKFRVEFCMFFLFDGRRITGSVDKKHFNGKLFSQILDCANIISLIRKKNRRGGGSV